jgi:hypothetical protein
MFFMRQVFVNIAPGPKVVPSGTVTSAMNCAQSQVDKAAALCVVTVAAGTKDINMAASIIINPVEILDFITFSLIKEKNNSEPYGRRLTI